jgi:hypothetical protein
VVMGVFGLFLLAVVVLAWAGARLVLVLRLQ